MHPPNRLVRLGERALSLGLYLAEAALGSMVVMITVDVFLRNTLGAGFLFVTEYCGYLLVLVVLLGAPYSLRHGHFLRIELVVNAIRPDLRRMLGAVYATCSIIVSFFFLYEMARLVVTSYSRNVLAPTLTYTPLWIPQLILPIGFALMIVALLIHLFRMPENEDSPDEGGLV